MKKKSTRLESDCFKLSGRVSTDCVARYNLVQIRCNCSAITVHSFICS